MKTSLAVLLSLFLMDPVQAGGTWKEVCHQVKGKSGKMVQECKKIKVHKKLDGKKVPEPKKKK
jgi:hypothetical protein